MLQDQGYRDSAYRRMSGREPERTEAVHKLNMTGRSWVEVTGVTEVISFDSEQIQLETTQGAVKFSGEGLHVKRLSLERGEADLEGKINEILYFKSSQEKSAGGVLRRLFG